MKSSIKRDYAEVDEYIKKIVKCINEADDELVEYRVPNEADASSWPAHIAAMFLAEQVREILKNKDITSTDRDTINVTFAVYFWYL